MLDSGVFQNEGRDSAKKEAGKLSLKGIDEVVLVLLSVAHEVVRDAIKYQSGRNDTADVELRSFLIMKIKS